MTQIITGGLVSVEDGIKKAEEYAPARKVRVELHFDAPEGMNGQNRLEAVAAIASAQVEVLLGRKTAAPPKAEPAPPAEEKRGPGRPKKVETPPTTSSPAAIADELDEFLNGAPPEPISDKQLLDAIKEVNTAPTMIQRIKETVLAFCPREDKAGFRVADIAQEHRQMFLDKLKGLSQD